MELWLQLPCGLSSTNPLPTPPGEKPKAYSVLPAVLSSQNESHSSRKYRVSWLMDLPRREVLVRVLFLRVFMCFTLGIHWIWRIQKHSCCTQCWEEGPGHNSFPFMLSPARVWVARRDSAPLFHTARQCCRFLTRDQSNGNPTPPTSSSSRSSQCWLPNKPRTLGS